MSNRIGSDLTAIQLDQKVTAAALQAGESPDAIAALLQQGPYARFQQDVKQVSADTIEQYARGTIAQVQEIQSLSLRQQERSHRYPAPSSSHFSSESSISSSIPT
ncbi:MAG: hypothetical protein ACFE0I_19715 [Elainellaceae cyanobacterium]